MYITKETKWQLSCRCHDNSDATDPVLIITKIPRFHLTQGSSTPNNLMGRVEAMWAPCLFRGRPPVPLKKVANGDIWFFTERDWSRVLPWQRYGRCHFVSFVMYITGANFEDNCFNISGDIRNSVFYICIIQKPEYLKNEKRYSKKENTILLCFEKPSKQAVIVFYFIGTLTRTIWRYGNCFLSPVATDGNGLKFEKIGQLFQISMPRGLHEFQKSSRNLFWLALADKIHLISSS